MVKITEFIHEIRSGSSLPIVVDGDDGKRYVAKLHGSGDGVFASIIDWISIRLGKILHIPVLEPVLLRIDDIFIDMDKDPEIVELIEKSVGLNFGTCYKEDVHVFGSGISCVISKELKDLIFLYDLFLLNVDRKAGNTNIICNEYALWCLDFSSSIAIRSAIEGSSYQEDLFLAHMKNHPFYSENIKADSFIKKMKEIKGEELFAILEEMPDEWFRQVNPQMDVHAFRSIVSNRLFEQVKSVNLLMDRLQILKKTKELSEDERRANSLRNRKNFEKKYGKF